MPDDHLNDTKAPRSLVDGLATLDLVGPAKITLLYVVTGADGTSDMSPLQQKCKERLSDTRREKTVSSSHTLNRRTVDGLDICGASLWFHSSVPGTPFAQRRTDTVFLRLAPASLVVYSLTSRSSQAFTRGH